LRDADVEPLFDLGAEDLRPGDNGVVIDRARGQRERLREHDGAGELDGTLDSGRYGHDRLSYSER
jgi:hypothetical protein